MTTVNVHEAKTHLSRLLEQVRAGEEIVISNRGKPVARLCPIDPPRSRVPGLLKGTLDEEFFEALPEDELEAWER